MRVPFLILAVALAVVPLRGQSADVATNAAPDAVPAVATTNAAPAPDASPAVVTNAAPDAATPATNAATFVDPLIGPDNTPPPDPPSGKNPIKRFDGHMSLTTGEFTAPDAWELRWHSDQLLSIGVIRHDGTVVAGTTGRTVGSLYVPQGGSYRLRVKTSADSVSWDIQIVGTKTAPTDMAFYEPTGPDFKPETADTNAPPVAVVAPTPVAPSAPAVPRELTTQQRQALVTIKGDRAQGNGFFMKHGKDIVLITTQQLLANNPNWQISTASGSVVQVTKINGASDRDVAMLSVKDFGYTALDEGDPMKLKPGDALLTSAPIDDDESPITVGSLGLMHILTDPLRPTPGSPVILASSGRVVGVVAVGPQTLLSASFNDESFGERNAKTIGSTGGYGLRFDNVPTWETCDAAQLQVQALFLSGFHQRSRALDAYINGSGGYGGVQIWKADDKIKSANDSFVQDASGGASSQRTQALQTLLFELGVAADADTDQIKQPQNFYGYERVQAQDEIVYRKAIKAELDQYSSDAKRFNTVASQNNGG